MDKQAIGIDVGSQTTKAVLLTDNQSFIFDVIPSGDDVESSARQAIEQVLKNVGLDFDDNACIVSTGIGGKSVSFCQQNKGITTCLARGVHHLLPSVQIAIDIGAESGTVIRVNERGKLSDWANHDKCAAGTGIFLQQMSKLMQMTMEDMSALSFKAQNRADITSTCAVFAESEVISHVHRVPPTPMEDIAAGIYYSIVSRIMTLLKRIGIKKDVAAVGGVALNKGLVNILEQELGFPILVSDTPQIVAALGAAIIARENCEKAI
jgi:predicted CoA-substrate-specific enzyme activase